MTKMFFKAGLGLLAAAWLLPAAVSAAEKPALPAMTITPGLKGQSAINALGVNLAAVAAHYGKTTNQLVALLNRDAAVRLDGHGNLYYVCTNAAPANHATNQAALAQLFPFSQTFLLHSKPGSTRTIYLDFDGYTISGTAWNDGFNGGANIVAPPWDIDGNPGSFSTAEQTTIQQVWLHVAEDYAPFDVDVTTEYPGEAAMTRSNFGDQIYGTRALISPITSQVPGFAGYGGLAYVGIFNNVGDYYKPALIFPENLGNDAKNIAEAASHEVGHNLGLSHQGTTTGDEYYIGQGNWAPIMGVGYYVPISQWAKGEYANANNTEDELFIITQTGLSYRAADFGNSITNATALFGGYNLTNGIIGRSGEQDFFSFQTGPGTAFISVTNWELGSDLHMIVGVYDSAGNVLTNLESVDSAALGTQGVKISLPVSIGKYYVSVGGKGSGNPVTTGYSAYASLGHYTLNITNPLGASAVISAPPPPYGSTLSGLNGGNPNGAWYLFIQDDKLLDAGSISNGWILNLTTANPVGYSANLVLSMAASTTNLVQGGNVVYTIGITNYGPSISSNTIVSDTLPSGFTVVATNSTQGSVNVSGSAIAWNVGTVAVGAGAQLTLTAQANVAGNNLANTATATANTSDPNPSDNSVVAYVTVGALVPPQLSGGSIGANGAFLMTVSGSPVQTIIQASTNLVTWLPVFTNLSPFTTPFTYTNLTATNYPYRFYRAVTAPAP